MYKVCWSGPTQVEILSLMPVEDLCRRFASSLFVTVGLTLCRGRRGICFPAYIEMDLISSSFPAFFFLSSCAALFVQVMFTRPGAECA